MPTKNAQHITQGPTLQPAESTRAGTASEPISFVELVLFASECSEDEGEVRDLVDALFEADRFPLKDLSEERIALA